MNSVPERKRLGAGMCILCFKVWCLLIATAVFLFSSKESFSQEVKRGRIDLTNWNLEKEPVMSLGGTWAFYWNELLFEQDIARRPAGQYIQFSMPWNKQPIAGEEIPAQGFATYYAEVFLPGNLDSVAVDIPAVYNSYELWINGAKISSNGTVGIDKQSTIPFWLPVTKTIPAADTLRIVFHVANFHHDRGGSIAPIKIGRTDVLMKKEAAQILSVKILIISCFIIFLFCLGLFFIAQRTPAGYFAAFVIVMAIRALFSDPYLFHIYFHGVGWTTAIKIEYSTIPLLCISGILFMESIYPRELQRPAKFFFAWLNVMFCFGIVIADPELFSKLLVVFQAAAVAEVLYCFYVVIKAIVNERVGSWFSCASIVILGLIVFYNLLVYLMVFELNYFVISLGYLLSLILTAAAIFYRSESQISAEGILTYNDLYKNEDN